MDLFDGTGLGPLILLIVAEAGSLGGGILSCLGGCGAVSLFLSFVPCERLILLFEAFLFHPRLNFLLNEVPDDGVPGSSGLDAVGVDIFCGFVNF
jgi:hypothetical protein